MADPKSKAKRPQPNNFLEALRELGRDVATEATVQIKHAVTNDVPESLGLTHPSGTLKPNEKVSLQQKQEMSASSESKTDTHFSQHLARLREEEMARVRKSDAEIREQIKAIQAEIKSLAKAAGQLAAEVEVATMQATVNPGEYHVHFFARLKSMIVSLRKKVNDSSHWLAEFNGRNKKQKGYWASFKKSGTSFMLSSERYMVTSTG